VIDWTEMLNLCNVRSRHAKNNDRRRILDGMDRCQAFVAVKDEGKRGEKCKDFKATMVRGELKQKWGRQFR
jgi:hypothetical protein